MPTPNRKKMLRQQQRKRRQKRQKNLNLTKSEIDAINNARAALRQGDFAFEARRPLSIINQLHQINFLRVVQELNKRFPEEVIEVLSEGSGLSSFPDQLKQKAEALGINVNTTRADAAKEGLAKFKFSVPKSKEEIDRIIRETVDATPEELIKKFGRNRFHLVESTIAGISYTPIKVAKGLENIFGVLKPGGTAYIVNNTQGSAMKKLNTYPEKFFVEAVRRWGKQHPNASVIFVPSKGPDIIFRVHKLS